jgi:hypothetical protein
MCQGSRTSQDQEYGSTRIQKESHRSLCMRYEVEVEMVQSYKKSQGSRNMWSYDVSLEPMFCLIVLLRLDMMLNPKV